MDVQLGLRKNWKQFLVLVVINAFVGGMIGLERTILPRLAEQEFQILAKSVMLSFIVVFGFTKANLFFLTPLFAIQTYPPLHKRDWLTI